MSILSIKNYRKLIEDVFAHFSSLYENQFIEFFEEGRKSGKGPFILGIEYPDHPNLYADGISMRLRVLGLTDLLYHLCNSVSGSDIDVKDKNVLIIDLHAAPELVVYKYMKQLIRKGASDVRYFSPVPRPIYYGLQDLEKKSKKDLNA